MKNKEKRKEPPHISSSQVITANPVVESDSSPKMKRVFELGPFFSF